MTIQPIFGGPHVTAIGSGKGGTGKTFVSLSLAHAFAQEGERVLLCDGDLGLSNTTVHLGIDFVPDIRPTVMVRGEENIFITAMSMLDPSAAPPGQTACPPGRD